MWGTQRQHQSVPQGWGVGPGRGVRGETLGRGKMFGSDWRLRSHSGAPLTPSLPAPGPAAPLPVLQHTGRLRRLLQPRHEILHIVEHVVQDVLRECRGRTGSRDVGSWPLITPQAEGPGVLPGHCLALSPYSSHCRPHPQKSDTPHPQQSPTPQS